MFNTSTLRILIILISATGIVFSTSAPDYYSDNLTTTSILFYTRPVPKDLATELQNDRACGTGLWADCKEFLETHLNKDSKEYKQLHNVTEICRLLDIRTLSPSQVAAFRGYTELIQVLLRNGAPINQKYGSLEETLIHNAAEHGKDDLVVLLLTQGADIQVQDRFGNASLHKAVRDYHSSTVKLLLDAGADANVVNEIGETPLFQTIKYLNPAEYRFVGRAYIAERFVEYMAKIRNSRYFNGKKIIKLLLDHGAYTDTANDLGETPLHVAAKSSNLTIVQVLITGGAYINVVDINNQTPLHLATESNNVLVVQYLVTMGCDKTITDAHKKTALDIAKEKNFTKIVDLLS